MEPQKPMETGVHVRVRSKTRLVIIVGGALVLALGFSLFFITKNAANKKNAALLRAQHIARSMETVSVKSDVEGQPSYLPGQVLVKFKAGISDARQKQIISAAMTPQKVLLNEDGSIQESLDGIPVSNVLRDERVLEQRVSSQQPESTNAKQTESIGLKLPEKKIASMVKVQPTVKAVRAMPKATKEMSNPAQKGQSATTVPVVQRTAHSELDDWRLIEVNEPKVDVGQLVLAFRHQADVVTAQPNHYVTALFTPNDYYYGTTGSFGNWYPDLWGIKRLFSAGAWDISQGDPRPGSPPTVVAIVDTGIDPTHPDISDNIWTNANEIASNGIDDDSNGFIDDVSGWNFSSNNANPTDDHGHGTHVAGTVAGRINNTIGVVGVCGKCKVMAVKVLSGGGSGSDFGIAMGIKYATDNGARVINMSLGGPGESAVMEEAVNYAFYNNVLSAVAAGNSGGNDRMSPGIVANSLTVAALSFDDTKAAFSTYGDWVDVIAPGVNVLSLRANGTDMYGSGTHTVGDAYMYASGTSMATPHVAGLAGLLVSINPSLTSQELTDIIKNNADDLTSPAPFTSGYDVYSGMGLVNAERAAASASGTPYEPKPELIVVGLTAETVGADQVHIRGNIKNTGQLTTGVAFQYTITSGATTYVTRTTGGPLAVNDMVNIDETFIGSQSAVYTVTADSTNIIPERRDDNNTAIISPSLPMSWSASGPESVQKFTPVLADLNNDGQKEVVVIDYWAYLSVYNSAGVLQWRQQLYEENWQWRIVNNDPVIGDFDPSYPGLEIIAMSAVGRVYAFHHDGTEMANWVHGRWLFQNTETRGGSPFNARPTLADINSDGHLDVVVPYGWLDRSSRGQGTVIAAFQSNGTPVPGWETPISVQGAILERPSTVTVVDINPGVHDGPELFVTTTLGEAYGLKADGTKMAGWSKPYYPTMYYNDSIASGEIDPNSPGAEVILGSFRNTPWTWQPKQIDVSVYTMDGKPASGWETPKMVRDERDCWVLGPAVVADLDPSYAGPEIVAGCMTGWVHVWHADGTDVPGWETGVKAEASYSAPAVADLDGDGSLDILFGPTGNGSVYAWHANGTPLAGFPLRGGSASWFYYPTVADLNGDGTLEIVTASDNGTIRAWSMQKTSTRTSAPWPQYNQNPAHTGRFDISAEPQPNVQASMVSPAPNQAVTGSTVPIKVSVLTKNQEPIDRVEVTVTPNGLEPITLSGFTTTSCGGAPPAGYQEHCYARTWNTTALTEGPALMLAKAYILDGPKVTSFVTHLTIDNVDCTLSMATPADGASVSGITPLAVNYGSAVRAVMYRLDSNTLGGYLQPPFSSTWDTMTVSGGGHQLSADGFCPYQGDKMEGVSAKWITVGVAKQFSVKLTNPTGWIGVAGNFLLGAKVNTSPNVTIDRVEFRAGATPFGVATPVACPVPVTVSAEITAPTAGAMLRGTVPLQVSTTPATVDRVEFYDRTTLIGSDTTAPYAYSWFTPALSDGLHALTAKAYLGQSDNTSSVVWVSVDNTAPTIPANLRRSSNFTLAPSTGPSLARSQNDIVVASATLARVEQTPGDGGGGGGTTKRFTLAWNAATDGGSGIAGYRLYSCAGASCSPSTRKEVGNVTSFVYTNATTGTTLNFQVTAVDNAGNESDRSNRLTVVIAP